MYATVCSSSSVIVIMLRVQAAIMACGAGVSRLVDVLEDPREEIRNELLLLLLKITESNSEIQKAVAFQEGFERLVRIMQQEGVDDGGIIIKDCLQIMYNMLANNKLPQKLFLQVRCWWRRGGAVLWCYGAVVAR